MGKKKITRVREYGTMGAIAELSVTSVETLPPLAPALRGLEEIAKKLPKEDSARLLDSVETIGRYIAAYGEAMAITNCPVLMKSNSSEMRAIRDQISRLRQKYS
jgi:hypothetical protein